MDLVISGGGTMTREAAVLGVPSYSFFRGRMGRVDMSLEKSRRLTMLRTADDVRDKLEIAKRDRTAAPEVGNDLRDRIVDEILGAA
jgi:predicted glycosyltransferase